MRRPPPEHLDAVMACVPAASALFASCLRSRCCTGGLRCFRKDEELALCRQACPSTWDCEELIESPEPSPPPPPVPAPPSPSPPPGIRMCIEDAHAVGIELSVRADQPAVFASLWVFDKAVHGSPARLTHRTALQPLTIGRVPLEARWSETLCLMLREDHRSQTCFEVCAMYCPACRAALCGLHLPMVVDRGPRPTTLARRSGVTRVWAKQLVRLLSFCQRAGLESGQSCIVAAWLFSATPPARRCLCRYLEAPRSNGHSMPPRRRPPLRIGRGQSMPTRAMCSDMPACAAPSAQRTWRAGGRQAAGRHETLRRPMQQTGSWQPTAWMVLLGLGSGVRRRAVSC